MAGKDNFLLTTWMLKELVSSYADAQLYCALWRQVCNLDKDWHALSVYMLGYGGSYMVSVLICVQDPYL
jgi:hypothetical protein